MPKVNKKIDYLKCSQCRKDRQKVIPEISVGRSSTNLGLGSSVYLKEGSGPRNAYGA